MRFQLDQRRVRTKDTLVIRGTSDDPAYFHIVEIVKGKKGYEIKDTAICGTKVDWAKAVHLTLNAVVCPSCRDAGEALGVL